MTSDEPRPDHDVGHLPEPVEPADAPASPPPVAPPDPPAPGGVYPAGTTIYGTPVEPTAAKVGPQRPTRRIAGVGAGAIALVAIFIKFVLPLLAATAVSGALGTVFGGPFEKLPAEQKQALEQRFDAAMADSLKGLSDAETSAKVDAILTAGLPRLGDDLLVERLLLVSKMLESADEATCSRLTRAMVAGAADEAAVSAAIKSLDTPSIGRWFDINVTAIEAESAKSQAARTADEIEVDRIVDDVFLVFTEAEARQIGDVFNGAEVADAEACSAARNLYGHLVELPAGDLAVMALYDVVP